MNILCQSLKTKETIAKKKNNENIKIKIKSSFFVKINEYLSILNIVTLTYYLYDNVYTFFGTFCR